ncbi:hypothetical protein AMECASPLE_015621 [Ameca splendens]|uniref:Uncharacterized protein n=1 Tax=Ameca splendens TaxID=208324 RepID=A0ABV0XF15_9TELE
MTPVFQNMNHKIMINISVIVFRSDSRGSSESRTSERSPTAGHSDLQMLGHGFSSGHVSNVSAVKRVSVFQRGVCAVKASARFFWECPTQSSFWRTWVPSG